MSASTNSFWAWLRKCRFFSSLSIFQDRNVDSSNSATTKCAEGVVIFEIWITVSAVFSSMPPYCLYFRMDKIMMMMMLGHILTDHILFNFGHCVRSRMQYCWHAIISFILGDALMQSSIVWTKITIVMSEMVFSDEWWSSVFPLDKQNILLDKWIMFFVSVFFHLVHFRRCVDAEQHCLNEKIVINRIRIIICQIVLSSHLLLMINVPGKPRALWRDDLDRALGNWLNTLFEDFRPSSSSDYCLTSTIFIKYIYCIFDKRD